MERAFYKRSRCQRTGTHIVVCPASDEVAESECEKLPWLTICDEHSTCCQHETLGQARAWATCPDWCEECQELMREGKKYRAS